MHRTEGAVDGKLSRFQLNQSRSSLANGLPQKPLSHGNRCPQGAVTWYGTASNHAQRRALVSLHQVAHGGDSFSLRYQRVGQELTRVDQAARAACHVIELELPLGEPALILQLTIQVFELELLLPQLRDVTHDPGEEVAFPDPEVADGQPCRKLASVST